MAFYIIETDEQLKDFSNMKFDKAFVELVLHNDHTHPSLNELSLLYIKPLNGDKGYILCLDHTETLSLNKTPITQILADYNENIC